MTIDPYIQIDRDYAAAVVTAADAYAQDVAGFNADLADALATAPEMRVEIFAAFELLIEPDRLAHVAALEQAQIDRETSQRDAQADRDKFLQEQEAAGAADAAEREALKAKLDAGTATSAEIQKALSAALDGSSASLAEAIFDKPGVKA